MCHCCISDVDGLDEVLAVAELDVGLFRHDGGEL